MIFQNLGPVHACFAKTGIARSQQREHKKYRRVVFLRSECSFDSGINVDIRGGIDAGEVRRFLKRRDIKFWVDDDVLCIGFSVAFLSPFGIGDRDHEECTLFAIRIVLVAFEEPARKRIAVVTEEKEFHPGITDDVVVVFENDILVGSMLCQVGGSGECLQYGKRFAFRKQCLAIIIGATSSRKEK